MARSVLSDEIWVQLQVVMKSKGCRSFTNVRNVMEGILWKLRTVGPWRDIPSEFCPWQTAFNRFNRWAAKGLWEGFFLSYAAKLTRSVRKRKTVDDSVNLSLIRQVTDERPSYGYRRVTAILRHRERRPINHKRVYRIMKENGLSLARFDRRPTRAHEGKVITLLSNTRWCSDGFRIQCWNGEHVMVAFSLDYCDRECFPGSAPPEALMVH